MTEYSRAAHGRPQTVFVLADAALLSTSTRRRLSYRVPHRCQPIHPAPRRARLAARAIVSASCGVLGCAERILARLLRSLSHHSNLVRHRVVARCPDRPVRTFLYAFLRHHLGLTLAALSFPRQCRPGLLRLRLGNHPPRKRFPRHLSRRA